MSQYAFMATSDTYLSKHSDIYSEKIQNGKYIVSSFKSLEINRRVTQIITCQYNKDKCIIGQLQSRCYGSTRRKRDILLEKEQGDRRTLSIK